MRVYGGRRALHCYLVIVFPSLCCGFATTRPPARYHGNQQQRRALSVTTTTRTTTTTTTMSGSSALADKVYLVTGSTDGIGRHTAGRLAEQGATVFVHGRQEELVQQAVEFVKDQQPEGSPGKVEGFVADVSSFEGMHKLCDEVMAKTDRLDCLINNAGVFETHLRHSVDGVEMTFAVNMLAMYVITGRLLDLVASAPDGGRILNVASLSASYSVDFDNLQFEKGGYSDHAAYSLTKLLSIMFTAELARKAPPGVRCHALDPGTVSTKMLRAGWGMGGINIKSADDEFFLATDPSFGSTTGEYYVHRKEYPSPPPAEDEDAREKLWTILEDMSGFKYA